ncbi:MAG: ATP-dependent DNA helicase RecG, partial [Lachnospiraceae bacterium]|nr:ATP-dependent DNA helicase RecG [Lachnospiraceae bacterium]
AAQHWESFMGLFGRCGIEKEVLLLTGSMTKAAKRKVYERIEEGQAGVVIGTHALFQEKVKYNNLALVVTDEQHRFGVRQRGMLVEKGNNGVPHVLVMSATPIPRTLAIMLYGDLDISVIDELPARRLPVKNCVVGTEYRKRSYNFIEKEIRAGHQAYVICPLVEKSDGLECEDVVSYTDRLREELSPDISIACLHGQMKSATKDGIMKDFLEGKTQVLVSTTVVEVGVNVPNATVMMIENSERFGLAQLHQLRGRIGRGDAQSYCIFIDCKESEKSRTRLDILNHSNDGFKIASEDLKLRGPGDMFGIRQSGDMQFKLGDVFSDAAILERASKEASRILKDDPGLAKKENAYIRERIDRLNEASDIHAL